MADPKTETETVPLPNLEQVVALVRAMLYAATGYMVGAGYMTADVATALIALAPGLVGVAWTLARHTQVGTLLAAARLGGVDHICVSDAKLAAATGNDPKDGGKVIVQHDN
jgi:hypothetical protein